MPSKLRDFGNGKIIERDFSLMLELAQYKRRFEFMLPKGQFRGKYSKITKTVQFLTKWFPYSNSSQL